MREDALSDWIVRNGFCNSLINTVIVFFAEPAMAGIELVSEDEPEGGVVFIFLHTLFTSNNFNGFCRTYICRTYNGDCANCHPNGYIAVCRLSRKSGRFPRPFKKARLPSISGLSDLMLSYQHHYHAGNHADVLKHWLLLACVRHMQKKDKPFDYIDTHAGAGLYRLDSAMARKTAESDEGVLKLDWKKLKGLKDYHGQIADDIRSKRYPGSPLLVKRLLRPGDKAWLYEMHPQTVNELREHCEHRRRCHVRQEDGFKGLPAILPTASRRALVLIDPSYEIKSDYQTVVKVMEAAYLKMPQAMLLLWYPVVDMHQIRQMEKGFAKSKMRNVHLFEMGIADNSEPGMTASGMVVVNPPWTLADDFIGTMPDVSAHLAKDHKARWRHQLLVAE